VSERAGARLYTACERLVSAGQLAGLALYAAGATQPARFGDPSEWSLDAKDMPLQGSTGGFSQAHAEINRRLVERVSS
jgi:hypothetical protein